MTSPIVNDFLSNIPQDIYSEVSLNMDIANRIAQMLKERHMTQRELAIRMGKKESEVSRWLTGTHGFNSNTLARIGYVLGEPVVFTEKAIVFDFTVPYSQVSENRFKRPNQRELLFEDSFSFVFNQFN